jgi:GalNAc-alpha-(1->4)-GalNAc-alpha-(1->3)-diNAcBac-PP-undecaprenol alpha-1,4-N-acetyl-D-galactosaminyltransferase
VAPLSIAWVLSSLACGGAERVATLVAGALAERGHRCTIVTLDPHAVDFHAVPPGVARVRLAGPGPSGSIVQALRNNAGSVLTLARALGRVQPDVVLSFGDTTNVKTILAGVAARMPVVVSERVDPRTIDIGRAWDRLRRLAYPRAAALVVQTEAVRAWAEGHCAADRVAVIPNPVEPDDDDERARADEIVAVGRLVPQKGFDVLLRAFARIADDHPSWRLAVLGDGPLHGELGLLARRLGIADRVALPGQVADVRERLRRAGSFVLSSRFEGFPNALLEAMAAGAPIVATDCKSGPHEILRDCPEALLVPPDDADELAAALRIMLSDAASRRTCGRSARAAARRFGLENVVDAWESVLARASAR